MAIIGGRVSPAMDAPVYYSKAEFIETVRMGLLVSRDIIWTFQRTQATKFLDGPL